ncbi:MAG TPA: hypothetical protein DCP75_02735, partial [Haliea salexigens]|nr:hypothetical protein [Haliea salexigens]
LVDLGPEGGSGGGQIIATGTPEEVAEAPGSYTGMFLKPLLTRAAGGRSKKGAVRKGKKKAAA